MIKYTSTPYYELYKQPKSPEIIGWKKAIQVWMNSAIIMVIHHKITKIRNPNHKKLYKNPCFQSHNATITCAVFLMDSRRVISSDKDGVVHVWLTENASLLQTIQAPYKHLASTNNMKFAVRSFCSYILFSSLPNNSIHRYAPTETPH